MSSLTINKIPECSNQKEMLWQKYYTNLYRKQIFLYSLQKIKNEKTNKLTEG